MIIAIIISICLIVALIVFLYFRKYQRIKSEQMDKLLMLISEHEMNNRQLKAKVSDLMRNSFSTINQLCYEYFEKADTSFLKKVFILRLKKRLRD